MAAPDNAPQGFPPPWNPDAITQTIVKTHGTLADFPVRPGSPWYRKFGAYYDTNLNSKLAKDTDPVHSGFAPVLPSVSPEAYERNRTSYGPQPRRVDDAALDSLFTSEKQQIEWNSGLKTWEAAVLNKYLLGGKRDDDVMDHEQLRQWGLVTVNEDRWNPVFKKRNWWNYRRKILDETYFDEKTINELAPRLTDDTQPGVSGRDKHWSVDQKIVWDELRVVLELANRWLGYMSHGPWLNNLLHKIPFNWNGAEGDKDNFLDKPGGNDYIQPQRLSQEHPPNRSYNVLRYIGSSVANQVAWRFVDDKAYPRVPLFKTSRVEHYDGLTRKQQTQDGDGATVGHWISIDINVRLLRVLIHPRVTLAERSVATVKLAATILAELMRATWKVRLLGWPPNRPALAEPFVPLSPDLEWIANQISNLDELEHQAQGMIGPLTQQQLQEEHRRWQYRQTLMQRARTLQPPRLRRLAARPFYAPDPFYGFEWVANLGRSAMNDFFGGDLRAIPDPDTMYAPGQKYLLSAADFPDPQWKDPRITKVAAKGVLPPWVEPDEALNFETFNFATKRHPLLGAWISSLLRQDFYTDVADRIGLGAFHAPKILSADCFFRGINTQVFPAKLSYNALMDTAAQRAHPEVQQIALKTLQELEERRQEWKKLTPWRDGETFRHWDLSPYANYGGRAVLDNFLSSYHKVRQIWDSLMQEYSNPGVQQRPQFQNLRVAMDVASVERTYRELNPVLNAVFVGAEAGPSASKIPPGTWVYLVLGALMGAVLPERAVPFRVPHHYNLYINVDLWRPSRAAAAYESTQPANLRRVFSPHHKRYTDFYHDRCRDGSTILAERPRETRFRGIWAAQAIMNEIEALGLPLPPEVWQALRTAMASFNYQLYAPGLQRRQAKDWVDFNFTLPPYQSIPAFQVGFVSGDELIPFTPDPNKLKGANSDRAKWLARPSLSGVPGVPAAPAVPEEDEEESLEVKLKRYISIKADDPLLTEKRYYTISEVGNHASWSLLPVENGEYLIYNVAPIIAQDPELQIQGAAFKTVQGISKRVIRSKRIMRRIRRQNLVHFGKLITPRFAHEVAERDGQDGRELWCNIGEWIYDLTELLDKLTVEGLDYLLKVSDGTMPLQEALFDPSFAALVKLLTPLRAGYIRKPYPNQAVERELRDFTPMELSRHVHLETGMYCAINGDVYDLGPYLHSHPGGSSILRAYAGKDASTIFANTHGNDPEGLLARYSGLLKVGKLVAAGTGPDDPEHPDYTPATLPTITPAQLRMHPRSRDGKFPDMARVAVAESGAAPFGMAIVYDVSHVFAFGSRQERQSLGRHLGRLIPESALTLSGRNTLAHEFRTHRFGWGVGRVDFSGEPTIVNEAGERQLKDTGDDLLAAAKPPTIPPPADAPPAAAVAAPPPPNDTSGPDDGPEVGGAAAASAQAFSFDDWDLNDGYEEYYDDEDQDGYYSYRPAAAAAAAAAARSQSRRSYQRQNPRQKQQRFSKSAAVTSSGRRGKRPVNDEYIDDEDDGYDFQFDYHGEGLNYRNYLDVLAGDTGVGGSSGKKKRVRYS